MQALKILFWTLLLILWCLFSAYRYVCVVKDRYCGNIISKSEAPVEPEISPLSIKDANGQILFETENNFEFKKSSASPEINQDLKEGLEKVASYLKDNPKYRLNLNASYRQGERNMTSFDNLGIARAHNIKQRLLALGVSKDQLAIDGNISHDLEGDRRTVYGGIEFNFEEKEIVTKNSNDSGANEEETSSLYYILDGKDTVSTSSKTFSWKKSSADIELDEEMNKHLKTMGNYLKNTKDRELHITGAYSKEEDKPAAFENLGIARADKIKQEMIKNGSDKDLIFTHGELKENLTFGDENSFEGGITFNYKVNKKTEENLLKLSQTLYFQSGSDQIKMTEALKKYFKDVKTYLEQAPDKNVVLTGHTDAVGETNENQQLGLDRAETVKKQLVDIGIDEGRISTESKGENQPAADNSSTEGKAANRRVTMIIK